MYIYWENWLKVISYQEQTGCKTSRKHKRISLVKIPNAKSGIPKHENGMENI